MQKEKIVSFRLTQDEWELLKTIAHKHKKSPSAWIREAVIKKTKRAAKKAQQ